MPYYSTETPFPEAVGYLTLPLSASLGSEVYPWGTAVLIAPGIALTARHVVDDFFRKLDGVEPRSGLTSGFGLGVHQPLPSLAMFPWVAEYVFFSPVSDIAVLALKPAGDGGAPVWWPEFPVLKLFPPAVGTPVTFYGYPGSHVILLPADAPGVWPVVGGPEAKDEVLHVNPATSSGEVLEFYDDGRDRVLMPWPAFRTNARYDGGMSGAPVYNAEGELCGIVCRSMPIHGADEHESYVSAIWPALGLTIEGGSRFLPPGKYPLLDLVRSGVVRAHDWQHAVAMPLGEGFHLSLNYPVPPGREVERRPKTLARVSDTTGRSVLAIDLGVGPTFRGLGSVNFHCENCDTVVADGLREFQIVDVVIRCQSCAAFLEFPSLPERATLSPFGRPVVQMSVGAYRISDTLELRSEATMVGVRPPQPAPV